MSELAEQSSVAVVAHHSAQSMIRVAIIHSPCLASRHSYTMTRLARLLRAMLMSSAGIDQVALTRFCSSLKTVSLSEKLEGGNGQLSFHKETAFKHIFSIRERQGAAFTVPIQTEAAIEVHLCQMIYLVIRAVINSHTATPGRIVHQDTLELSVKYLFWVRQPSPSSSTLYEVLLHRERNFKY